MKHKIIYILLFLIPGILASFLISLFCTGVIAGVFWLFVFGDTEWPDWTNIVIPLCSAIIFAFSLAVFAIAGYKAGSSNLRFSRKHVVSSIGITVILASLIVLNSFKGEIRYNMDNHFSSQCASLCKKNGYSSSSTPPKNSGIKECSCFDKNTKEWIVMKLPAKLHVQ